MEFRNSFPVIESVFQNIASPWAAQGAGHDFALAKSLPDHAAWIAAEILFCRKAAKKIGAESPVFCGVMRRKKCAQIPSLKIPHSSSLIVELPLESPPPSGISL
jgi:hypothetical protein